MACSSVVSWRDRLRHATDSALPAGFSSVPRSRDVEFDGGCDAASAVEDRHGDSRCAAFEFVSRSRDLRQPDDGEFLAQDVGGGDGVRGERGQPGVDDAGRRLRVGRRRAVPCPRLSRVREWCCAAAIQRCMRSLPRWWRGCSVSTSDAAQDAQSYVVLGCPGEFVEYRQGAHHRQGVRADFGLGVSAGDHAQWQGDPVAAIFGALEQAPGDQFRGEAVRGGRRQVCANRRSRSTCERPRRRMTSGSR